MTLTRTAFKRQPAKEPKPKTGPRQRKCKCCGASFVPFGIQSWCGPECGYKLSQVAVAKKKAKEQRQERAADKAKLKTRADWLREAQKSFNRFINKRDSGLPCCACGLPMNGAVHASHFLSVGAHPNLRFNEKNCHSGCVKCNVFLHGNLLRYRENLIERIGLDEVLALESDNALIKLTIEDLVCIRRKYDLEYKLLNSHGADYCV